MKFVFALLVIYLIATSFAATTKSKAKATAAASEAATREAVSSLKRLSSTRLGKTLIDTLQIELKANTGVDPRPRIRQLLAEILEETQDQIATLNDNLHDSQEQCNEVQTQLSDKIAGLESDISDATSEQVTVSADLVVSTNNYNLAVQTGESLQSELDAAVEVRGQQEAAYNTENARLLKIRNIYAQVNAFISERLEQRQNPSFLQKNNILVEIKKKVLSPDFQAVSAGYGKFIGFLVTKALTQIKQTPDDQAVELLSSIVNIINDLTDHVNQDINARNAIEAGQVAAFESLSEDLGDRISINSAATAAYGLEVSGEQARLVELAAKLEADNSNLASSQSALATSVSECDQVQAQLSEDLSQRNYEVEIIQEVIEIVNNQLTNLSAAVEGAVTA